jgi:hypothetical protein
MLDNIYPCLTVVQLNLINYSYLNKLDVFNLNICKYLHDRTKSACSRLHTINSRLQTTVNVY